MKSSTWIGFIGVSAIAALAWFAHQPGDARATLPPAPTVEQHATLPPPATPDTPYSDAGFHEGEAGLSPSARAGR